MKTETEKRRERDARRKRAADDKLGTTPTPWRLSEYAGWTHRKGFAGDIRGPGNEDKSCVYRGPASFEAIQRRGDAVRIVACVNACEGVSNEALERLRPGLLAKLVATALAVQGDSKEATRRAGAKRGKS